MDTFDVNRLILAFVSNQSCTVNTQGQLKNAIYGTNYTNNTSSETNYWQK